MVDLSRFRTGARPAINPPAPSVEDRACVLAGALPASLVALPEPVLEVQTVEGPGAELLSIEPEAAGELTQLSQELGLYDTLKTEPAPPPEAIVSTPKKRSRRGAEKQEPQLDAHEAEIINTPTVETATTEALCYELRDRGYIVQLELGR